MIFFQQNPGSVFCSTVVTVAGISCCVALCPSTCLLNRSDWSGPCCGVVVAVGFHTERCGGKG